MNAIGPDRAAALEHRIKTQVGHPDPLHYCHSWFHWRVSSLAELTQEQADELVARLKMAVPQAREQMQKEARKHG